MEQGSVTIELVLITPLLIVLILFVIFCGRVTRAEAVVRDAAAAGARAASLRQQPSSARADAIAAVQASLAGHGTTCPQPSVDVDTSALQPGGHVTVRVVCRTALRDLALLGVPGSRTTSATSVEPVDLRRGG
jgi:Flp pilus assembly protein TadG